MNKDNQSCFQFKASFAPCTILQMTRYDLEAIEKQLSHSIAQAPNFFLGSPVVVDLEKVNMLTELNFSKLRQILIAAGLVPVGVRGGSDEQNLAAVTAGMPRVSIGKSLSSENKKSDENKSLDNNQSNKSSEASKSTDAHKSKEANKTEENKTNTDDHSDTTKLVTYPIRSGMQVYAKEGNLIVVGQVSHGAELLADGHIHVYGPLRGRALAGMQGNINARIFCRTLEAELVAIAGYYLTKEDIQTLPPHDGMIQIYLENEQVRIEAI